MHNQKESKHNVSVFQGRLNLAAVSKQRTSLAVEYPAERIIFLTLSGLLAALVLCYLYFVSASVVNLMAQKEAMSRSAQINASIGSLEQHYFALSQAITPDQAVAIGLIPIQNTDYINRPGNVGIANGIIENRI